VRREQVAQPEMARLISELEEKKDSEDVRHHEQFPKFQEHFQVILYLHI
jgi:hypothetical protein